MEYADVPVSYSVIDANPYQRDPTAECLPCKSHPRTGSRGTPAPPPAHGQAPCAACPAAPTWSGRRQVRDAGPPCSTTEAYRHAPWPRSWGGSASTPDVSPTSAPELWQDLYMVKNRSVTGFPLNPTFNPFVL